jgi:hypothetical protein
VDGTMLRCHHSDYLNDSHQSSALPHQKITTPYNPVISKRGYKEALPIAL